MKTSIGSVAIPPAFTRPGSSPCARSSFGPPESARGGVSLGDDGTALVEVRPRTVRRTPARRHHGLAAVLGLAAFAAPPAFGQAPHGVNLLSDPGFESGGAAWNLTSTTTIESYGAPNLPGTAVANHIGGGSKTLRDVAGNAAVEQEVLIGPVAPIERLRPLDFAEVDRLAPAFVPFSEAILCGIGDAWNDRLIGELDLEGTGYTDLKSMAGSWVYLYDARDPSSDLVRYAQWLVEHYGNQGLIVIGVAYARSEGKLDHSGRNHPIWYTNRLGSGTAGDFGNEVLLDKVPPFELLIDPCGLIAAGGRHSATTATRQEFAIHEIVSANPGIDPGTSPLDSKLRRAIAKRDWDKAVSITEDDPESRSAVKRILVTQLSWTASHVAQNDPVSAEERLDMLDDLPDELGLDEHFEALEERLSEDAARAANKLQRRILKLAEKFQDCKRWGSAEISERQHDSLTSALEKLERTDVRGAARHMLQALKAELEWYAPAESCPVCGGRHKPACEPKGPVRGR